MWVLAPLGLPLDSGRHLQALFPVSQASVKFPLPSRLYHDGILNDIVRTQ